MSRVRAAQLMMDLRPYRVGFLARIASRDDVELTIYAGNAAPGSGAPEDTPRVAVPVVAVRNHFWPGQRLKVMWQSGAMAMLRSDADVVVCQEIVSNPTVWALRLLHRRFHKRLVLLGFFYRPEGQNRLRWIRNRLRRFLRASSSALVAYTERGRVELLAEGVAPELVFVNGNTLDTERLMSLADATDQARQQAVRDRLGIAATTTVLVFLGRLRRVKRVEVVIEAVRRLAAAGSDVRLVVIGDGEDRDRLEDAAAGSPVMFTGQTYDDDELAGLLSIASVMVLPGSVGLTCVHGFANDLPCITTSERATMQTPEFAYVEDGVNGLVVDTADPRAYAATLGALMDDPDRLESLRSGARATAERLEMGRMVESFVAALKAAGAR